MIYVLPKTVNVVEEQSLRLFCNASGHPAPNITWYKIGKGVVGQGDRLTINKVNRIDKGSYRCFVNNGEYCNPDSAIAVVTILCK